MTTRPIRDLKDVGEYVHPQRSERDPGGVFKPKPAARDASPRLTGPIDENRVIVPEGATLQARKREAGGAWSPWSDLAGDEFEFRIAPKLRLKIERGA